MPFYMPELIVEATLKEGFQVVRRYPEAIADVFGTLTLPYNQAKYGAAEIEKIKSIITNKEMSIVHAFNLVPANLPCISIQLVEDREATERAHMGNFRQLQQKNFCTPEQIKRTIKVPAFTATAFNPLTGKITVPDAVDLSRAYIGLVVKDSLGKEYPIIGGLINTVGAKQIMIDPTNEIDTINPIQLITTLDYEIYRVNGNVEETSIVLGIHTKEALLTKYMYTLVKYFMLSRKDDLIKRGLHLNTYSGSDFTRNMDYPGDTIYTRAFTIHGTVTHSWLANKVHLIDHFDILPVAID